MNELTHTGDEPTRFIDAAGEVVRPLPDFAENKDTLIALYRAMVLTRTFDAKSIALQRTGRLGTYPSSLGQEAVGVGVGHAMLPEDIFAGTYREHGAQMLRGVTLLEMLLFWGGDERGMVYGGPVDDFPPSIPIGSHAPHSVGAALAIKLRGEARASVCVFGDGATSKGDVYEAMNIAGVWRLPVLFVVNNNQWAISLSREEQSAAPTLAAKAPACGFDGEQVDGNDVLAVRHVVGRALERIRAGGGPHLVEALTYRLTDHTTADDASRYRAETEASEHWKEEPVLRLRTHLTAAHGWTRADEEALLAACGEEVDEAVEAYLATAPQAPESIIDHLYETLPAELEAERNRLRDAGGKHG